MSHATRLEPIFAVVESLYPRDRVTSARLTFDSWKASFSVALYELDSFEQDVDTGRRVDHEALLHASRGPVHDQFAQDLITAMTAYVLQGVDHDRDSVTPGGPGARFVSWDVSLTV